MSVAESSTITNPNNHKIARLSFMVHWLLAGFLSARLGSAPPYQLLEQVRRHRTGWCDGCRSASLQLPRYTVTTTLDTILHIFSSWEVTSCDPFFSRQSGSWKQNSQTCKRDCQDHLPAVCNHHTSQHPSRSVSEPGRHGLDQSV